MSSSSTVVTFDTSHKTVVAVCRCGGWRRVVLLAERPALLAAAASHVRAEGCGAGRDAHELARRAERSEVAGENPYPSGGLSL